MNTSIEIHASFLSHHDRNETLRDVLESLPEDSLSHRVLLVVLNGGEADAESIAVQLDAPLELVTRALERIACELFARWGGDPDDEDTPVDREIDPPPSAEVSS